MSKEYMKPNEGQHETLDGIVTDPPPDHGGGQAEVQLRYHAWSIPEMHTSGETVAP